MGASCVCDVGPRLDADDRRRAIGSAGVPPRWRAARRRRPAAGRRAQLLGDGREVLAAAAAVGRRADHVEVDVGLGHGEAERRRRAPVISRRSFAARSSENATGVPSGSRNAARL